VRIQTDLSPRTTQLLNAAAHSMGWSIDNCVKWLVLHWLIDVMPECMKHPDIRMLERASETLENVTHTPPMRMYVMHSLEHMSGYAEDPRD